MEDGFILRKDELDERDAAAKGSQVKVQMVPVTDIIPNPYQPRKQFEQEAMKELAGSIKKYGVLQPLLVTVPEAGKYLLIAGERRLRASRMAGITRVPVLVSEYTQQQIAEIAMIENLQREDLHYLEEAEGYERLLRKFRLTQEALAERVGKQQSTIANKLRLLRLPTEVRKRLAGSALTERHARVLLKLPTEESQIAALAEMLKKQLNVRQSEALVQGLLANLQPPKRKPRIVIVNDVRIYLNSVKQILESIQSAGIPAQLKQEMEGDDVVVTLRIKNTKAQYKTGVIHK